VQVADRRLSLRDASRGRADTFARGCSSFQDRIIRAGLA
jgi:hypothetical protein